MHLNYSYICTVVNTCWHENRSHTVASLTLLLSEQFMEDYITNLGEEIYWVRARDIGNYEYIVTRFQPLAFSQAFSVLGDTEDAKSN